MADRAESSIVQAVVDRFNSSSVQEAGERYGVQNDLRELHNGFATNVQAVAENGNAADRMDLRRRAYDLEDMLETISIANSTR